MITAADLPPLWFAGMDRRVMAHDGGDLDLLNVQPSAQQELTGTWG